MEKVKLPDELINAFKGGKLVPFFGAGLSKNVGMPTWNELIAKIGETMGYDPPELISELGDYLQISEYINVKNKSKGPLNKLLSDTFRLTDSDSNFWKPYELLLQINPRLIYTTNFDNSIEHFYNKNGKEIQPISTVNHLIEINHNKPSLIHFHGDLNYSETIVIAENDYLNRLQLESPMDIRFRSDLLENSFVFIGYSFTDFNLRFIWHKLRTLLNPFRGDYGEMYPSYFLTNRQNDIFNTIMLPKGLEIIHIDVDDIKELIPCFFEALLKHK